MSSGDKMRQVGFRLSVDMIRRIDGYARRLNEENRHLGLTFSRVDAARALITLGLSAADAAKR